MGVVKSRYILPKYKQTVGAACISIFYLLMLCGCKGPAQEGSLDADQIKSETSTVGESLAPAKVRDSISLKANQALKELEWGKINDDFVANLLNPFLASKRIRSACTDCDKIMFSFSFVVDGKGEIKDISKEGENISCTRMSETDQKKLEKEILIYMNKLVLPAPFYGAIYKGRLGFIRKC